MGAGHDHSSHGSNGHHGHSHAPAEFGRAFLFGIVLNSAFVLVEATYGLVSGSMALVADAGHNLSDVLALALAWGAAAAARKPSNERFTYGYKSSTILAALANAGLLLVAVGGILFETLQRMAEPPAVHGATMIWVAGVGIAINTGTALLFLRGRHDDLNVRGAFLHMATDALVSLGVVLAGMGIVLTGQRWIDPVTSLAIVAVIAWGTWGLLKDSIALGLLAAPKGVDVGKVRSYLDGLPGVATVHDLHIWPMSTTETALTAHLVMPSGHPGDGFLADVARELHHTHRIGHATVQIETSRTDCSGHC